MFEKDTITGSAEIFNQMLGVNVILSARLRLWKMKNQLTIVTKLLLIGHTSVLNVDKASPDKLSPDIWNQILYLLHSSFKFTISSIWPVICAPDVKTIKH